MARRSPKPFQRTDRIGELIREIVASELERIGDERLEMVTVTAVKVDRSLDSAEVFYSAFSVDEEGGTEEMEEALAEVRWPIQQVVNRQVRARRTPQIRFTRDDVLLGALRIDELLHGLGGDGSPGGAVRTDAGEAVGTDAGEAGEHGPGGEPG